MSLARVTNADIKSRPRRNRENGFCFKTAGRRLVNIMRVRFELFVAQF